MPKIMIFDKIKVSNIHKLKNEIISKFSGNNIFIEENFYKIKFVIEEKK